MSAEITDVAIVDMRFSALCFTCKPNGGLVVTTGIDNICPHCGTETAPESREYRRQARLLATVAPTPPPPVTTTGGASVPVVLPSLAGRWHEQTTALYAQLDREESDATEAMKVAQERLLAARRSKAAIGKVLEFVTVADAPLPKAKRALTDGTPRPAKQSESAQKTWPVRVARGLVERCKDCGTTERPPFTWGRCEPCYRAMKGGAA